MENLENVKREITNIKITKEKQFLYLFFIFLNEIVKFKEFVIFLFGKR